MSERICHFSFSVVDWHFVADRDVPSHAWQLDEMAFLQEAKQWSISSPKLDFLPPLKRRRLSESARLFFSASWELTQNDPHLPVVYASQNSEMNRSFALWQSLLTEGDISPTSFSLSVHNALIGQWSEMRQVKQECTAIAAQQDNLETALLEAYLMLNDGAEKVLVVVVETPLHDEYTVKPVIRPPFGYALALVVEQGKQFSLIRQAQSAVQKMQENRLDSSLTWVQQHFLGHRSWQTSASGNGQWLWQKN
ncbi:beta-ketoacyl synthase chain length factor [Lonepinella sp. MS14436]|uniref:beta-ketoacyl synthase chain length factor n=1 Tax=Lonepinella sp. MS14436 TaxID=3003619 RepID=UPI0036DC8316